VKVRYRKHLAEEKMTSFPSANVKILNKGTFLNPAELSEALADYFSETTDNVEHEDHKESVENGRMETA